MEPIDDHTELVTPILNFKFDVGRMQVPAIEQYPTGEGVLFSISEPLDEANPETDWITRHYLVPPDAAKAIGSGIVETADEAKGTGLIVPR